jgi:hypothetical protein
MEARRPSSEERRAKRIPSEGSSFTSRRAGLSQGRTARPGAPGEPGAPRAGRKLAGLPHFSTVAGMTRRASVKIDWAALLKAAQAVRKNAYAPYSKFNVGAAVLGGSGRTYTGCNVENSSFGLSLCAERNAVGSAVAAGEKPSSPARSRRETSPARPAACASPGRVRRPVDARGARGRQAETIHALSDLLRTRSTRASSSPTPRPPSRASCSREPTGPGQRGRWSRALRRASSVSRPLGAAAEMSRARRSPRSHARGSSPARSTPVGTSA